jgi:hypothetical protein
MRTVENLVRGDTLAILRATPRHGWVWTILPSDCRRAEVHGEPALAAIPRDAGVPDVSLGDLRADARVDAILLAGGHHRFDALRTLATRLDSGGIIAVTVGSGGRTPAGSRPRRVVRGVADALTAERCGRVLERQLRHAGLRTIRIATGPRWRAHALAWPRGRRVLPADAVVAASAGERRPSVLELAIAEARSALDEPPEVRATSVRGSGALLVELSVRDDPNPKLLRVAAGPAATLLEAALRNLATIGGAAPPAVMQRLPPLLATGDVGLARYALEPELPGRAPRHLDARLWTDCLDFLVALRATPGTGTGSPVERLLADARLVSEHVGGVDRAALHRLGDLVRERLAELRPGWAHGDFWVGNLLVRQGQLAAVLDWDAADPDGSSAP